MSHVHASAGGWSRRPSCWVYINIKYKKINIWRHICTWIALIFTINAISWISASFSNFTSYPAHSTKSPLNICVNNSFILHVNKLLHEIYILKYLQTDHLPPLSPRLSLTSLSWIFLSTPSYEGAFDRRSYLQMQQCLFWFDFTVDHTNRTLSFSNLET